MSPEKVEPSTKSSDSFTRTCSPLTEQEKQFNDDYEWCLHDTEVRRQYGDQVVAVHQRRIWGAGANHLVALNAALQQPGCPPRFYLALVVVPPLVSFGADSTVAGS
jgi:hypothetical protein